MYIMALFSLQSSYSGFNEKIWFFGGQYRPRHRSPLDYKSPKVQKIFDTALEFRRPDFQLIQFQCCTICFFLYHVYTDDYSSLPNKRTCTPYLIPTKLPPCTLLFGTASLSIFWIFVKYSGLNWKFFAKN